MSIRTQETLFDQSRNTDRVNDLLACIYCLSEYTGNLRQKYQELIVQKRILVHMNHGYVYAARLVDPIRSP
jgi:hypothetical protein